MRRNPTTCPHNITEIDNGELWCTECGDVLREAKPDDYSDYDDTGIDPEDIKL